MHKGTQDSLASGTFHTLPKLVSAICQLQFNYICVLNKATEKNHTLFIPKAKY